MELLGGLLVLAVMAWFGLTICAGGLCAEPPHQDVTRPLPKAERPPRSAFRGCPSLAAARDPSASDPEAAGRGNGSRFRGGKDRGMGLSCWDEACDVNAINRLVCGNDVY